MRYILMLLAAQSVAPTYLSESPISCQRIVWEPEEFIVHDPNGSTHVSRSIAEHYYPVVIDANAPRYEDSDKIIHIGYKHENTNHNKDNK